MKRTASQFSQRMARHIMLRDLGACVYCDGIATQIDHVIPRSKGGPSIRANGVAACIHCNTKKLGRLSEEYLVKGLVHLARKGEDISWVDLLYTTKLNQLASAEDHAIELLLQGGLTPSEISFVLGIDRNTLKKIMLELGVT